MTQRILTKEEREQRLERVQRRWEEFERVLVEADYELLLTDPELAAVNRAESWVQLADWKSEVLFAVPGVGDEDEK